MTHDDPKQTQEAIKQESTSAPAIECLGLATDLTANARGNQAEGNHGRT